MSDSGGPAQSGYGGGAPDGSLAGQEGVVADPQVSYDLDQVVAAARARDPGLPEETARELATYAGEHLRDLDTLDAPELARRLMADHPAAGATPAAVVAKAAVDFCAKHGTTP